MQFFVDKCNTSCYDVLHEGRYCVDIQLKRGLLEVCVLACILLAVDGYGADGLTALAAGLVCAGVAILAFYGCRAVTGSTLTGTRSLVLRAKSWFVKGVEAS